jgi:hypothetical protein
MRRRTAWVALAAATAGLGLAVAFQASAQQGPPNIPDEVARMMLELGLKNIDRAACDGFNTCAPTTPEELANPPITIDHARAAVLAGSRTALARWCGLDADRRSVAPMVRHLRRVLRFDNRQVTLMAVIHSIQQSRVHEQLKAAGTCDAKTRAKIDAQLPER